ncbi:MAG: toll/interleukin-1 receptor domain-containing protein, partial [Thermoanaerobaculia bacterium]|nr:toll/interleukin-1 receptor domain-containing protein [Thermoanaerobaculia bacterium]
MVKVYFCYADEDESFAIHMEKHLAQLEREGLVESYHKRKIIPGDNISSKLESYIDQADLILFLLSPDFFASDYIYNFEMKSALERQKAGLSKIIS